MASGPIKVDALVEGAVSTSASSGYNLGVSTNNIKKEQVKMRNKALVILSVIAIVVLSVACTRSYDNHKAYIHAQAAKAAAAVQARVAKAQREHDAKVAADKLADQQASCVAQQADKKVTSLPAVCVKGATTPTVLKSSACAITPSNGQVAIQGTCGEFAH